MLITIYLKSTITTTFIAHIIHFFVFNILHLVNRHVRFILLTLSELSINANQRQFSKMRHSLCSDLTRKTHQRVLQCVSSLFAHLKSDQDELRISNFDLRQPMIKHNDVDKNQVCCHTVQNTKLCLGKKNYFYTKWYLKYFGFCSLV